MYVGAWAIVPPRHWKMPASTSPPWWPAPARGAALEFAVVYALLDTQHGPYMNSQQNINLNAMKRFNAIGADIALSDGNRAANSSIALARRRAMDEVALK
jgi:cytolysin (calcineurin-like family phosphatase)